MSERRIGVIINGAAGRMMAPTAAPDLFTGALLVLRVAILLLRCVGPFPLVLAGAVIGVLRRALPWGQIARLAP